MTAACQTSTCPRTSKPSPSEPASDGALAGVVHSSQSPCDKLVMVRLAHADSLYERIAAEILRRVAAGELRPGDRLPPIRQAAGAWGVNLNTVARAYAALAERGILETRTGAGTVVARRPATAGADGMDAVSQARAQRLQSRVGSAVLEALAAGYAEAEIEAAVSAQLARWRAASVVDPEEGPREPGVVAEEAEDV